MKTQRQPRKTRPKSEKKQEIREQQQIRMKDSLKARIHEYQQKMEADTGLEVTFSSAVRSLIEKGLEAWSRSIGE